MEGIDYDKYACGWPIGEYLKLFHPDDQSQSAAVAAQSQLEALLMADGDAANISPAAWGGLAVVIALSSEPHKYN